MQHDTIETLHPLELALLREVESAQSITVSDAQRILHNAHVAQQSSGQSYQVISWLAEKALLDEVDRTVTRRYGLTDRGKLYAAQGLPEQRIVAYLQQQHALTLPALCSALNLTQAEVGSAFGRLQKHAVCALSAERKIILRSPQIPEEVRLIEALLTRAVDDAIDETDLTPAERMLINTISKKRGASAALFRISEKSIVSYRLSAAGRRIKQQIIDTPDSADLLSALTPESLQSGRWKGKQFRRFNLTVPPSRVLLGRTNAYAQYVREVKDRLVGLGFVEFDGPLVETEFWNCDALYMPQFHAARDTHDVYRIAHPTHAKQLPHAPLDAVAAMHEHGGESGSKGWNYTFDRDFTKRLILRSQGTALSAKQLAHAPIPSKYFGIVRCFRYDQVDATHLSDFYQTEGIVLGEHVNLRTLLGLLRTFATEIAGAEDVRFVPGYFPFTEPSIEVHIKHPQLGWFELGGSGIFRPEVTAPFNITVPVLAWGLGIDRMALLRLQLSDLRDLFTTDLERVRLQVE